MKLTLAWNGGQNVAMFEPSAKLMVGGLVVFLLGILFVGLIGLVVLAGVGLVLWNVGTLLFHLAAAIVATDLLVQGLTLLLIGAVLCSTILFFLRSIWSSLHKPVQTAH